jgi:lipopolysaccharide biosynthesis regulator YciM
MNERKQHRIELDYGRKVKALYDEMKDKHINEFCDALNKLKDQFNVECAKKGIELKL